MTAEHERTRLIGEIASLLKEAAIPDEARAAGLTLIGWLARRMPGEEPSTVGVHEMTHRAHGQSGYGGSNGANGPACPDMTPFPEIGDRTRRS
jgi:hypothetical protein